VITVLGAGGFIGSHLVRYLRLRGLPVQAPARDATLTGRDLGHVIDCVGVTGDFRERPLATIEAHIGRLPALFDATWFESYLYLSSTRLYRCGAGLAREEDPLVFDPADPGDLYNLSKAAGEALVLSLGAKGRVARLANVYGAGQRDTFLASLLAEAEASGILRLRTALDSERDYISIEETVDLLVKIALGGRRRLYNVASGVQISHARVAEALTTAIGWPVEVHADAPTVRSPPIDVSRIRDEFGFVAHDLLDRLPALAVAA
jgi:nucleoside-diphosphate-sugar epimerase